MRRRHRGKRALTYAWAAISAGALGAAGACGSGGNDDKGGLDASIFDAPLTPSADARAGKTDSGVHRPDSGKAEDGSAPKRDGAVESEGDDSGSADATDSGTSKDSGNLSGDDGGTMDSGGSADSSPPSDSGGSVESGPACSMGTLCTPTSPDPCALYATDCSTGSAVCLRIGNQSAGFACATGGAVCNGDGVCGSCEAGASCVPAATPCMVGALTCATGSATCAATAANEPDDTFCATNKLCASGSCVSSLPWITRGEDNRTFTGGYVYSIASATATVSPDTTKAPFTPSAGGLTGMDLRVTGTVPPQNPVANLYPIAGLGWNFLNPKGSFDASATGKGIDLWVESAAAVTLQINLADVSTDISFSTCSTSTSPSIVNACYDYPLATCSIPGGSIWTECHLLWTDFVRPDFGNAGAGLAVDPTQVTFVQINPVPTLADAGATASFDFAVDDVSFIQP